MTGKSLEKNVKVKLGLLEAKAGKDASISWCKAVVNSRKASKNVKSLLESTVDSEAAIGELRRQKVESKFYHIKSKVLPKQMKKVKVFLTQRVVKKIKQKKIGEEGKIEDVKELESELVKIKSLDHVKLAIWAFSSQVLKDEYLRGKMVELGIAENTASLEFEGIDRDKISSIKCFQDAIKTCRNDLIIFMRKLLHEAIPEPVKMAEKEPVERKMSSNKLSLSVDKSFFMDSLNADESDIELKDNSDIEGRVAFTDDEDDENGSGYFDSEVEEEKPKRKKNRLGQLARRRLAEKMYGREAKHIKSGGLTVQQKEELRKQNSQQKKERAARIKKDAAKFENLKKKKVDDESVSEFKKVAAIKIDPKMHPSWAAKLQQQAKAQQATFQGQKIKFDE